MFSNKLPILSFTWVKMGIGFGLMCTEFSGFERAVREPKHPLCLVYPNLAYLSLCLVYPNLAFTSLEPDLELLQRLNSTDVSLPEH